MTLLASKSVELRPEAILDSDPAQLYELLHPATKKMYLDRAAELARNNGLTEAEICEAAVRLASGHEIDAAKERRLVSHAGYYLLEPAGVDILLRHLGKQPRPNRLDYGSKRLKGIVWMFFVGTILLTAFFSWLYIRPGDPVAISVLVVASLFLIAASTVRGWIVAGVNYLSRPRVLPELDLSSGLTEEYKTVIAVPALLFDKGHVDGLIRTLERHWKEVKDSNASLALLSDLPDCDRQKATAEERELVDFCAEAIAELNEKPEYRDLKPFFLLHREHRFCKTQGCWIGWERKRGKLHQLFALIGAGENTFDRTVGNLSRLRGAKYVVVLDEDTRLEPQAVHRMIGAHAHPLNHPRITEDGKGVERGYGIVQPWISNDNSGGKKGAWRPKREFFQDAFERTSFWGKGSINVNAYQSVLSDAIPEDCVLSHDYVESGLLPTGALMGVMLFEPIPKGHAAGCLRNHRWLRGDWQNGRFLLEKLGGRRISAFGKINVADVLLSAALPMGIAIATFRGFEAAHGALVVLILLAMSPLYLHLMGMAVGEAVKGRLRDAMRLLRGVPGIAVMVFVLIEGSAHKAAISADALVRSLYRMARGRRLLEWQSAAFTQERRTKLNICRVYHILETVVFGVAGVLIWVLAGKIAAAVLLFVWALHPSIVFASQIQQREARRHM
ncbi:MAG: hypothetical protein JO340_09855 [Acidobacteriaceae bacterium]|nr:hypothetical protein [Acidobacteriaceae bacterium]